MFSQSSGDVLDAQKCITIIQTAFSLAETLVTQAYNLAMLADSEVQQVESRTCQCSNVQAMHADILKVAFMLACRHDAFFYFHNINAYESEDDLCIDLAAYEDNQIIVHLHRANLLFKRQEHPLVAPRRSVSSANVCLRVSVGQISC